jgi:flagellar P-ring protein precursor FlgI
VGRVPNGATIERPAPTSFGQGEFTYLNLHRSDFTTAKRVADAINEALGGGVAVAGDGTTIRVASPRDPMQRVGFVSMLENLTVDPGEAPARVVVNSRSGTVVIGQHVRVSTAAVAHGNLSVTISNTTEVSQPAPLGRGRTAVVPNSEIRVSEESSRMFVFHPGVTLDEVVRAINEVGAAPSDLVAILEALRAAGSLRAELVVI